MNLNTQHLIGFAAGVAVSSVGFYMYKKNQASVDSWLRSQGIRIPQQTGADPDTMTLEDLVVEKERLEDLIATREMAQASGTEE